MNEQFEHLNANFEEWKNPLDQQVKRLCYENIAYDRELKRYRNGLRELFEAGKVDPSKIVEIHTSGKDIKYVVPEEGNFEHKNHLHQRRSSLPNNLKRESELKEVKHYFKNSTRQLYRYQDLKK